MRRVFLLVSMLAGVLALAGCGPKLSLGSVIIGTTVFDITSEGSNAAGSMTNYAIKPEGGNAGITMVQAGVGADANSAAGTMVTGTYDAADGDYDCNVALPNPIPANAMLFITVTTATGTMTGSIAVPAG